MPTHEWSLPRQPFCYDEGRLQDKTTATIAAISYEKGIDTTMHFHRSVNIEGFVKFLEKLRHMYPKEKLTLFMD